MDVTMLVIACSVIWTLMMLEDRLEEEIEGREYR